MKVLAYMPLLYGADYLRYSLLSVYNCVDEILILYTSLPSHGTRTHLSCPDTRQQLLDIAHDVDTEGKIMWQDGSWARENDHRNHAHNYARRNGFDILVALDFDEVWKEQDLKDLIQLTYDRKASKCLIWMRHLWRSFNYICDDDMRQERIYYLGDAGDLIYAPQPDNQVWHFGYARTPRDIEYKISIHGHKKEWIDRNWMGNKFLQWPPAQDVHPTCRDKWYPKPFDKTQLPEFMREHPNYNKEVIE